MTLSGLGVAQECGYATSWRVQTKAVAACVLGKTASGDAAANPRASGRERKRVRSGPAWRQAGLGPAPSGA